jgi:mono/diheme cytochrome c family protein
MQLNRRYRLALNLLIVFPVLSLLTACGGQVTLQGKEDELGSKKVTLGDEVVYPNDRPSVPDGKLVWLDQKNNCASCHGTDGSTAVGPKNIKLSDKGYMRLQKPVDQYSFIWFGKDAEGKKVDHPTVREKLSRREAWSLVFYLRSLAIPPLKTYGDKDVAEIDAVFGSNCAVCHGKKGNGDGPLAHSLEPQPANFQTFPRFYDRTDAVLWDHIANGIPWEGMPNFLGKEDKPKKVKINEEYVWKLVQYVRNFQETTDALAVNPAPKTETKNPIR